MMFLISYALPTFKYQKILHLGLLERAERNAKNCKLPKIATSFQKFIV